MARSFRKLYQARSALRSLASTLRKFELATFFINSARVSVVLDGQPPRRALVGVFETELDFLLDVAAGALSARPSASSAPCAFAGGGAAKEGLEEIRKRVLVAEHLAHFVFGHRAEPAALRTAAEIDVPTAELTGIETRAAGAGLFVRAPVRPELVVLPALLRIAEHLVGLVDFLEFLLGRPDGACAPACGTPA